ncbi:MAG TPA: Holliday junction resolvase RuvX [Methylomusa anaerophila]|uniref:Putative pre-16S rRNA nuclease n=1 Tax=Methylomusa anaerophila TaxID=1930071 RepID=A0A348AP97_9FIRM|nr:Holliday junction resolvase RuvX [Methylomusa anaerophila]BBB92895.1 putative Holliday junction resolvase [Methylomusa anaerophila]HML87269.1 Holliday junction resolvase RuvX [Methylomusa anaerophila]
MRILALDVGDKTIGVAVSDELKLTAQGVEVIRRAGIKKDFTRLRTLIEQFEIRLIIIGLPKNMNGTVGPQGELVEQFAEQLSAFVPQINIRLWDERLSTIAAEKSLIAADVSRAKRRQVIDKMAAVFILQGYLDSLSK